MEYYRLANNLAVELLGWVEQYTPSDIAAHYSCPLSSMIEESQKTLLRVLHYPPFDGTEEPGAIRAAAHEDINLLTILPAANEPGLQVKGSDGEWMDVPCDFGTLIINIGDMLQEASHGYYPPPPTASSTRPAAAPLSPASPCRCSSIRARTWCSPSVTPPTAT